MHWRKSRKRLSKKGHIWHWFKLFVVVFIVGAISIGAILFKQAQNGSLRQFAQAKLAEMVGDKFQTDIEKVQLSFGGNNLVNVDANSLNLKVTESQKELLAVENVSLGISTSSLFSGLLKGTPDFNSVKFEKIAIKLPKVSSQAPKADKADKAEIDEQQTGHQLQIVLRKIHQQLAKLVNELEQHQFKKIIFSNAEVSGLKNYGINSDFLVLNELVLEKNSLQDPWVLNAEFLEQNQTWGIEGTWQDDEHTTVLNKTKKLDLTLKNFVLSEILSNDFSQNEKLAIEGNAQLNLHLQYSKDGEPIQATADLKLGKGKIQLPNQSAKFFKEGVFEFELDLENNQITMTPSVFVTGNTELIMQGKIDLHETEEGKLNNIAFDVSTLKAVADVQGANSHAVPFDLELTGKYSLDEKILRIDRVFAKSEEGELAGSMAMDFNGKSPAMKLDIDIPKMSVAGFKQLWPYPFAPKARLWVLKNMKSGTVENAFLKADIPHGILGNLKKGAVIKKEHLWAEVPISKARFKINDKFPDVQNAKSTIVLEGMNTRLKLENAYADLPNGGRLNLAQSSLLIEGDKPAPNPVEVNLNIKASMHDVLKFVTGEPINAKVPQNFAAQNIKGDFDGGVRLNFVLKQKIKKEDIQWQADFNVLNFSTKKPINNLKLSAKKLHVKLDKTHAEIEGDSLVNNVPVKLQLTEVFNKQSKKKSSRKFLIAADAKIRKSLGIDLEQIILGTLPLEISYQGDDKPYQVNADLTQVELRLPWMNWIKGKGIAGQMRFNYLQGNKQTKISDFKILGKNFHANGNLTIANGELKQAVFKKVALNSGDNISINLTNNNNIYDMIVTGKSFDARAMIKKILDGANKASQEIKQTKAFHLVANLKSIKGFNKQVLRDAKISLQFTSGSLRKLDLNGKTANSGALHLDILPEGSAKVTNFTSSNAGAAFAFFNLYDKMRGGATHAKLIKEGNGPYEGRITFRNFVIVGEPRLKRLVSQQVKDYAGRDKSLPIDPSAVKFIKAEAELEKGDGYLVVKQGLIRNSTIGSSFRGTVFDKKQRMKLDGTFMPAYGINRLFGKIPLLGIFLGNGSEGGLFGITYRLSGNAKNPNLDLNPLSVVTPGIFRQIFQVQN